MSSLQPYVREFAPILVPILLFLAVNHIFNFELSFFAQPVYGYGFSGRLIGVIQISFSVLLGYKPVPPVLLFKQLPFYYAVQLDVRAPVLLLWLSLGFLFTLSSGNPRGTFQSSSLLLLFIISVFLWGLNTRHSYTWLLLTVLQANPLLTYIAGYLLVVSALGLSAYTSELLTSRRRRRVGTVEEHLFKVVCPRCRAEFSSNPVYCSSCGFRIDNTE